MTVQQRLRLGGCWGGGVCAHVLKDISMLHIRALGAGGQRVGRWDPSRSLGKPGWVGAMLVPLVAG